MFLRSWWVSIRPDTSQKTVIVMSGFRFLWLWRWRSLLTFGRNILYHQIRRVSEASDRQSVCLFFSKVDLHQTIRLNISEEWCYIHHRENYKCHQDCSVVCVPAVVKRKVAKWGFSAVVSEKCSPALLSDVGI
jgi:hypothetical protein